MTTDTNRNRRRGEHSMARRLITRAIGLAALSLPRVAAPAGAVIDGTADGARHP